MYRKPITTYKPVQNYKNKFNKLVAEVAAPNHTKICCPSCDGDITAADININDKIAKCGECNAVFSIAEQVSKLTAMGKIKEKIIRPEGIDVFRQDDNFEIILNQPATALEVIGAFLLPLVAFVSTLLYIKKGIPILFPAAFWSSAIYSIYNLIWRDKHKIFINIDQEYLSIFWQPNKLQKDKKIKVSDIEQIYVKDSNTGGLGVYAVVNSPKGQKHIALISGMSKIYRARYLEQEIERQLNITNKRVPEEKR